MNRIHLKSLLAAFAAILLVSTGSAQTPTPTPDCTDNTWTATSTTNALTARAGHTAVWTGREMIVWGGEDASFSYVNTGGRFNSSTNTWTTMSTTNAPTGRAGHTAVWTGSEMIVWGGLDGSYNYVNTGGRYNPTTNTWTAITIANAPTARPIHTAVWTGREMIIWGGGGENAGAKYDPATDSWTAVSTANAPTARDFHTAVWTGHEMIVWGGIDSPSNPDPYCNTGGKYNPATDSWTATSTTNAPSARAGHTSVWTGSEMIVWGGSNPLDNFHGAKYNATTNSWTATSTINAPLVRSHHTPIWTGREMIVWGGWINYSSVNTGGRYDLATDTWTATSTTNAPAGRWNHAAVWTGSEMIVWGGYDGTSSLNTGAQYCDTYPTVSISGNVSYCSNPGLEPVPSVTLIVTGNVTFSTTPDDSGNYVISVPAGGAYDVTPTKTSLSPGAPGISTSDVIATKRHYLQIVLIPPGCRLAAADVNGDKAINTVDVSAIQRFFLTQPTGTANVGKYLFSPASRSYPGVVLDQTSQNYDALVLGDVASAFVEVPDR